MASYDDTAVVSGSVVSFADGADDVPTKSLVVTIPASLSGVSSVSETQTGRNLLPFAVDYPNFTQTKNDMTISVLANGKVKFNGITTASTDFTFYSASTQSEPHLFVKNGTYTFSNIGSASVKMVVSGGSNNGFPYREITNSYYTGSVTDETKPFNYIIFRIASGVTLSDVVIEPMLEIGSTAHAYEPYTTPTTYTASLGRTIYGGQPDIVNGVGRETSIMIDLAADIAASAWNMGATDRFRARLTQYQTASGWSGSWQNTVSNVFVCENPSTPFNNRSNYSFANIPQNYYNFDIKVPSGQFENAAEFAAWLANTDGNGKHAIIVIDRSTPETFTFDGQEINTRLGYNAFWSDSGDTEVTYYKSGYGFTSVTVNRLLSKNLFSSAEAETKSNNSVSITCDGNGKYSATGTATGGSANVTFTLKTPCTIKSGMYLHLMNSGAIGSVAITLQKQDNTTIYAPALSPANRIADLSSYAGQTIYSIRFYISNGATFEMSLTPMICFSSTATTYEPYVAPVSKTAYLHKVIYGGQADVVKGTCEPKNILLPSDTDSASTVVNGVTRSYSLNSHTWTLEGTNTKTDANWLIYNGANYVLSKELVVGDTFTYSHTLSANCYSQFTYKDTNGATRALCYLAGNANKNASVTFTVPSNFVELLRFQIGVVKTATSVSEEAVFQLEKASSKTEYAPHFAPFTFPPISIGTDEGENTLFANEGTSAITYRKETD